ncbi:hypothetical protein FB451DRAFT_1394161 [Mycena latifolia]|nr:hypothetical protein FB451DRAFT_1394161 [Mycena latifolia]
MAAPRITWTPNLVLFDTEAVAKQRRSTDIVVFCPTLQLPVKIAWPTYGGVKIPPKYILNFLRRNGLHWSCFCTILCDQTRSPTTILCVIVNALSDGVFATCGSTPLRCSFFLDLTAIHNSTAFIADYIAVPTELGAQTNASHILRQYLLEHEVDDDPLLNAQRLGGYCGEHNQGEQPRRMIFVGDPPALPPPRVTGRQPVFSAPPPSVSYSTAAVQVEAPFPSMPPQALNHLDLPEAVLFQTFARGGGVTTDDFDELFSYTVPSAWQLNQSPLQSQRQWTRAAVVVAQAQERTRELKQI